MTELEENLRIGKDGSIEQKGELRVNGGEPVEQWRRPYLHELLAFIDKSMQRVAENAREEAAREALKIADEHKPGPIGAVLAYYLGVGDAKIGIAEEIAKRFKLWAKYKKLKPSSPQQEKKEDNG